MKKYSCHPFVYPQRTWPDQQITQAPIWCSVDLRDGNQALINPMDLNKKLKFFKALVDIGFKEIEVGFPSASQIEYDFLRHLIDYKLIPDDVTIQVLTQAREELIKKTMESIKGAKNVIVHLYNSVSVAQRKIVFNKSKEEIKQIAIDGVNWIKENLTAEHQNILLQYSPESFTGAEVEYSLEVCEAVMDSWPDKPIIFNLPATVELFGPHVFADMIEWFNKNIKERERITLSVHTHNDRGTGIAASELAVMAGADRVEGTLFGNGERTGNVDIVTLALNLYSHGIDPKLDLHDLKPIIRLAEECTELPIHQRHPYAGELVFTAFSGSHQDAIKKGFHYQKNHADEEWQVPYLAIDPQDIGRNYEAVIRINSQSGKGGTAYVMESEFGYHLPKPLQVDFSKQVQKLAEDKSREIQAKEILDLFRSNYIDYPSFFSYHSIKPNYIDDHHVEVVLTLSQHKGQDGKILPTDSEKISLNGEGGGPLEASKQAFINLCGEFDIVDYQEHSLSKGANARAVAYIQLENANKEYFFGAGEDQNITTASIKALTIAVNKLVEAKQAIKKEA